MQGAAENGAQQKDSQATLTKDETGLFGQNQKGTEEGGETAETSAISCAALGSASLTESLTLKFSISSSCAAFGAAVWKAKYTSP